MAQLTRALLGKRDRRSAIAFGRQLLKTHLPTRSSKLEAALILACCLGVRKEELYTYPERSLSYSQFMRYYFSLKKRCSGLALAYIVGEKEFYGRPFYVNRSVLVPRPDTETIIDAVLEALPQNSRIHDACTGSGCIGITLALEGMRVSASDVSKRALRVCATNNRRFSQPLQALYASDCLQSVSGRYNAITANPPYLRKEELDLLKRDGRDPRLALYGGKSGIVIIQRLIEEAPPLLSSGGMLCLEIAPHQAAPCLELAQKMGYAKTVVKSDLAGKERVVLLYVA